MAAVDAEETEVRDPSADSVRGEARAWFADNWNPELTLGDWWERLAEGGWGLPTWPTEWFGRGLSSELAAVVDAERARAGAFGPPSGIAIMMAGPTIIDHATSEQKPRFLPDMATGRKIWCQLFSEPGAGSDLAGLRTRAERDGEEWVVTGQKVWTSGAQVADWGILIARTNWDAPKHRGITYFAIDMHQPGIEVRPLREMTGGATFNEVYLTEARVSQENVIGDVAGGWPVAVTTLAHERRSLGPSSMAGMFGGGDVLGKPDLTSRVGDLVGAGGGELGSMMGAFGGGAAAVAALPKLFGKADDAVTRQEFAHIYTSLEISRYTALRSKAAAARGERPGPEVSTGKLQIAMLVRQIRDALLRLEGPAAMLSGSDAPLAGMAQFLALFSPAVSIAGGTDEIQRNIVGERALGLAPEPRIDKDLAFRDINAEVR